MRVCVNLVIYNTYIYEKNKLKLYAIMIFVLLCTEVHCQKVAIKSNLLYDVTATVNAGIEVGLAPKWTFDLSANYNGWTFHMSVSGNIGFYNQKGVIGFVIVSLVILLVFMLWVGSITLVI